MLSENPTTSRSTSVAPAKEGVAGVVAADRGYNPLIQDHFLSPRNVGALDQADIRVGTATVGSRDQGGIIRMQIQVDESGIINVIRFKAYGCGATIAVASWVTEWAKGKRPEQIMDLHSTQLIKELSLPPVKTHCAMLAEDAIKAAVDHYMQRQESS